MKRLLLIAIAFMGSLTVEAQQKVVPGQSPTIIAKGHYNKTTPGSGVLGDTTQKTWTGSSQNVLYTKTVTITNTANDTLFEKLIGAYNSVYTWCHVVAVSGTPTTTVLSLQVSGDIGNGKDWTTIHSASLTATDSQTVGHLVNTGHGWPYTNWRWILDGGGTQVSNIYSGVVVKYMDEQGALWDNRRRHKWVDDMYFLP